MQSTEELLTATYKAFNMRDINAVFAMLHADVNWPNGMEGGRLHGKDQVRLYWTRQWSMMDPNVEPLRIQGDEQGRTVVDVHQLVRDLSGTILVDQMVQHVYSFRNGLIERMDIRAGDTDTDGEGSG